MTNDKKLRKDCGETDDTFWSRNKLFRRSSAAVRFRNVIGYGICTAKNSISILKNALAVKHIRLRE